ncbi:PAS domain-containing protein [Burkholderia stagnalis]|uniref:helix-turn-helix domain-containing protein n=1 Tax=Burkholderia stagnalis TaxID=1503054 RepID=UPI000F57BA4E|nr:PAS domain-containing protein [Burkholderia stagnalis]RQX98635.1 PAS domain-containing protein [Burkholderia stagnalis]RQY12609.1 PAS domain-containing protein [Burkholderia stagnalis]RQY28698.1 PAS domain-containing protein [Burkholderia stagnalis]
MKGRPRARITLTDQELIQLKALAESGEVTPSVALRSKIVLACADTADNKVVADKHGVNERTVRKWQARFNSERIAGLYDAPRPGAPRTIDDERIVQVKALASRSGTVRPSMAQIARASGISRSTVARIRNSIDSKVASPAVTPSIEILKIRRLAKIVGVYADHHVKIVVIAIDESLNSDFRIDIAGDLDIEVSGNDQLLEQTLNALLIEIKRINLSLAPAETDKSVADFVDVMCRSAHASELHVFIIGDAVDLTALVSARQQENPKSKVHGLRDDIQLGRRMADAVYGRSLAGHSLSARMMPRSLMRALATYLEGEASTSVHGFFCWIQTRDEPTEHGASRLTAPAAGIHAPILEDITGSGGPVDKLVLAFDMAPIGLLVTSRRIIEACNHAFSAMFGYDRHALIGSSLEALYPSPEEFLRHGRRIFVALSDTDIYSDERIMRRIDNTLFWCRVSGRALKRGDPHAAAVWTCEDISTSRRISVDLTTREREIAHLIVRGKSTKHIAKELLISPRTVEAHRARLMRKYGVRGAGELMSHLIGALTTKT